MIKSIVVAWALINVNVYNVTYDIGGPMVEYMTKARELGKAGTLIRIDGVCASSCLVLIHDDFNTKYCATKKARLGFHMPYFYNTITKKIELSDEWRAKAEYINRWFIRGLPPKMQKVLVDVGYPSVYRGDQPLEFTWIMGEDAIKVLGECAEGQ